MRRVYTIGSSFTESSHTVINLGHEDGPPRLVSETRRLNEVSTRDAELMGIARIGDLCQVFARL